MELTNVILQAAGLQGAPLAQAIIGGLAVVVGTYIGIMMFWHRKRR